MNTSDPMSDPHTSGEEEQTQSTYHSDYDSYRFQDADEKEDKTKTNETNEQMQYGYRQQFDRDKDTMDYSYTGNHHSSPGYHNNGNNPHPLLKALLIAGVFGAVAGLVFFVMIQYMPRQGSSNEAAAESSADSQIVLGKQGEELQPDIKEDESTPEASSKESHDGEQMTVTEVTRKVMPSMVAITNTTVQQYQDFFGEVYDRESVSAGSGIIVGETDTQLLIATNNHVISGSTDITVTFVDNSAIAGVVQGADADNDLAIVSVAKNDIPEGTMKEIRIVSIGDSDSIEVGDSVVAIGNALGYGQSVSAGIISAKDREVEDTDGTTRTMIQTDASINPGNSGGALLNLKGELIGINEAKLVDTSVEGVGYAIPMSVAEPILTKLGNKASREKVSGENASYIGITCVTMPSQYTQSGYPEGVYVASVENDGPAAKAGIQKGDIITAFDGNSVMTKEELISSLEYYAAGEQISVSVSRMNSRQNGFEKKQFTVTLGSKSDAPAASDNAQSNRGSNDQSGEFDSQNGYFGNRGSIFDFFR